MVQLIIARAQYDERPTLASDLSFEGDKGVTKQSDLKDTDINALFKRFEKTGQLPEMILKNGHYGDFSSVPEFQEAQNIIKHADEQFANLDVTIRNRFQNDPAQFLEFVTNPNNLNDLEQMGLLKPEIVAQRVAARKIADDAAALEAKSKEKNNPA